MCLRVSGVEVRYHVDKPPYLVCVWVLLSVYVSAYVYKSVSYRVDTPYVPHVLSECECV